MTEQEWLTCPNPLRMLRYVGAKSGHRNALLLTCACLRRIWEALPDRGHAWVEMAERVAEGQGIYDGNLDEGCEYAIQIAGQQTGWGEVGVIHAVQQIFHAYWEVPELVEFEENNREREDESRHQTESVRCIFGNPFHPITLDPKWLNPNVVAVAQTIYDQRRFHDMPVLADALEEAGCTNADILNHCRSDGPHVRGCWVVDLILGKQ